MGFQFSGVSVDVEVGGTVQTKRGVVSGDKKTGSSTTRDDDYSPASGKYWVIKGAYGARSNSGPIGFYLLQSGVETPMQEETGTQLTYIHEDTTIRNPDSFRVRFGGGTSGALDSSIVYEEFDDE